MENNNQKRKVISDKSFEYIWFLWKTVGLYRDEKYSCLQKAHVGFIIACVHGMTILTFIVQFFLVKNLKQLLNILPMNVTVISCLIKLVIFLDKRHKLVEIHYLFAKLDSKNLTSEEIESLEKLNRFCKKMFIMLFVLYASMITSAAINAAFSHRQTLPFDIWLPYDYRSQSWLYWITFAFQYSFFITLSNENVAHDLIGPLYFILLNRHLEIILDRIEKVGWDKEKTQEENYQDFIDCIEDHKLVMG
ncbi:unnamed protein product [Hermetia illucens]|uniref:Uncharacterized protein n=1 Tax=Hermetia illucens TaxID=343691 RepID=A0A7R8UY32_HERIL|nr:odorant receptor 33a-like [Hermetia illucens]CAD7089112.1 unnamed protein product [Hermetia illucens]